MEFQRPRSVQAGHGPQALRVTCVYNNKSRFTTVVPVVSGVKNHGSVPWARVRMPDTFLAGPAAAAVRVYKRSNRRKKKRTAWAGEIVNRNYGTLNPNKQEPKRETHTDLYCLEAFFFVTVRRRRPADFVVLIIKANADIRHDG